MAQDITQTRREKIAAHLLAAGGTVSMPDLHEWSSLKLLCGHAAFSQLMEGMVDDNLVKYDGSSFQLLPDGTALAEVATARKGKRSSPAPDPGQDHAPAADHDHDHDHAPVTDHGHDHDHAPAADHGHDHGHDHAPAADHGHDHGGHDHDHAHDSGPSKPHANDARYGDGKEIDLPKDPPRRKTPPPPPPPAAAAPRTGLRATLKAAIKSLLPRGS